MNEYRTPRVTHALIALTLLALGAGCVERRSPATPARPAAVARPDARQWLREAVAAMGGEARLRTIRSVDLELAGHRYLLEQSERPEGPWLVSYLRGTERRDVEAKRSKRALTEWVGAEWSLETERVVAGGEAIASFSAAGAPPRRKASPDDGDAFALAPERLLLTALGAADLRAEADVTLQGVAHHVTSFSTAAGRVRLTLNAATRLPTAVETTRVYPYDMYWAPWGDVTTRTLYSLWALEPGGVHFPRQWDVERNGQPFESWLVRALTLGDGALPDGAFGAPPAGVTPAVRVRDLPLGSRAEPPRELAPGVVQIPGLWFTLLVRQPDGVVIIEAPISSAYSRLVLDEAARRFAGVPIKAVVSTSDSWPHLGGLREYVARGVPVYLLDLNRPIVERLLAAPHRLDPDALARAPRRALLRPVGAKTSIGGGPNRIELYPLRTESGERMMMAYMPDHRLLYGSDLAQPTADGLGPPQYLAELRDAVAREGLTIATLTAMHLKARPWSELVAAVERASAPGRPPAGAPGGASGATSP